MSICQMIGEPYLSNFAEGILFSIFALIVGIISSALGVGGGFITTPSLLLLGIEETYAIGTVLFMIIFIALSSTIAYSRQKSVIEYRTGILVAFFTVIGALIGSYGSSLLASDFPELFRIIFAIFLFPVAIKMIFFPKQQKKTSDTSEEKENGEIVWFGFERREIYCALLGLIGGTASGLLGIGGGVIMVPILIQVGKLNIRKAAGTSMFIMIWTSLAGATVKMTMGQIHLDLAAFLIIGIIIGAQIGPRIIRRINTKLLQQIFGFVMVLALISIAIGRNQVVTLIQDIISLFG